MSGSWWATVWSSAMETRVFDDTSQLAIGKRLAIRHKFGPVEFEPGAATLRHEAWTAQLGIRPLDEAAWETFCAVVASDAYQAAAVLTGELPSDVFGLSTEKGVSLSPERGRVVADCSCNDWHEPCKHVGALTAMVSDLIEVDPWILLLLLGRDRNDVVARVRALRAERRGASDLSPMSGSVGGLPAMNAHEAFGRTPRALPQSLPIVRRAGEPVAIEPKPPVDSGVVVSDLRRAVVDAARRATDLLADAASNDLLISVQEDLARMACSLRAADQPLDGLAAAADMSIEQLEADASAWSVGGQAGLAVARDSLAVETDVLAPAVTALGEQARTNANTVTYRSTQLRIDASGAWWLFESDDRLGWVLSAGSYEDPVEALGAETLSRRPRRGSIPPDGHL